MQLYLLRHGIAEEGNLRISDAERSLTSEGRRKLRQVLGQIADSGIKVDLIVSSPLKRAIQTAEIARTTLKAPEQVAHTRALVPGASVQEVWDEVRAHSQVESLMLVGHNPIFSHLASFLLGAPEAQVDFKKGSVMRIDFENIGTKPRGVLRWYLTPRLAEGDE